MLHRHSIIKWKRAEFRRSKAWGVSSVKGRGTRVLLAQSYREGLDKPTVGRRCDLLWVVMTTYSRFFRRPTVHPF